MSEFMICTFGVEDLASRLDDYGPDGVGSDNMYDTLLCQNFSRSRTDYVNILGEVEDFEEHEPECNDHGRVPRWYDVGEMFFRYLREASVAYCADCDTYFALQHEIEHWENEHDTAPPEQFVPTGAEPPNAFTNNPITPRVEFTDGNGNHYAWNAAQSRYDRVPPPRPAPRRLADAFTEDLSL